MADIEEQIQQADSTPEEAAENIQNASIFSIEPTAYKQYKEELNSEAQKLRKPTEASDTVKEFMTQSSEHTSLAEPDIAHLSYMERQIKLIGDYMFERPTTEREVVKLSLKKMNDPQGFSEDDQIALDNLNFERSNLANRNYGLDGPIEQIPAQVAGAVTEVFRSTALGAAKGAEEADQVLPIVDDPLFRTAVRGVGTVWGVLEDSYDQLVGSTRNELSHATNDQGQPLNLDDDTLNNISRGVGVVGTAMTALTAGAVTKVAAPFMGKFLSPVLAKKIVESPANAALMKTLVDLGMATTVGSAAAGVTEVTRIVGEEMAQTYDGTEASFLNALANAAANAPKHAPRVGVAVAVGGATALTLGVPAAALGYRGTRAQFRGISETVENVRAGNARDVTPVAPPQLPEPPVPGQSRGANQPPGSEGPVRQSVKILQLREAMTNVNKVAQTTKMAELAPGQLSSLKQKIFANAGFRQVWVAWDDFKKWSEDPKRAEAARKVIDPSGVAAEQMNQPIKIEPHKFMELVREFPDALDIMRIEPDGPSPKQAEKFISDLEAADTQRQDVLGKLGVKPQEVEAVSNVLRMPEAKPPVRLDKLTTETLVREFTELETKGMVDPKSMARREEIKRQIIESFEPTPQKEGKLLISDWGAAPEMAEKAEHDYLNQPTFTKAIESVVSKEQVQKFNDAQTKARLDVDAAIKEGAAKELGKVVDQDVEIAMQEQYELEIQRIENDPAFQLSDKFLRDVVADKKGKPISIYAVDPGLLTDDQIKRWATNPTLKKRGVFQKGGLQPEEAARLIGARDSEELFRALARSHTREDVALARTKAREVAIAQEVMDHAEPLYHRVIEAYRNNTANHLAEMKFMREQKWPATKIGIKKIALPLPPIEELQFKARAMVKQTKVGDLNVTRYKSGERRSQRMAVESILKNEVEQAFIAKENAALNSELQKETYIAIGRVNRVLRLGRRFDEKRIQQELRDAGKAYVDAATEILDVFNLDPRKAGLSEQGAYIAWVKKEVAAGRGNFEIPERLSDVRQSVNDLTVEAVELIGDRLRAVLHLAKLKNRLFNKFKEQQLIQTEQAIASYMHDKAIAHPAYDPERIPSVQEASGFEKTRSVFSTVDTLFNGMKHIVTTLDQEQLGGDWYQLLVEPLTGAGKYDKLQGYSAEINRLSAFKGFLEKNIKEILGQKEWRDLQNTIIYIPEFANLPRITKDGHVRKGDLMIMMANLGDPDGRVNLQNLGVSLDVIQRVLDRELEAKHADFVHNFFHRGLEAYWPESQALQKRTTGQDVTPIKGVPWNHRGVQRPGGYFPQRYRVEYTKEAIEQTIDSLGKKYAAILGQKEGEYFARQYAAEMTEQGRFIQREGSDRPLDLSFNNTTRIFEEVIHDLSYREPVSDGLKLLRNETIKSDMVAIVGDKKYNMIVNTYIETANRIEAENQNYFGDQGRLVNALLGGMRSSFAISLLGANITSVAIQPVSMVNSLQKMGLSGGKHMLNVLRKMAINPHLADQFYQMAVDINPSMKLGQEGLADSITSTIHDLLPSRNLFPKLSPISRAGKMMRATVMAPFRIVDDVTKTIATLTAYEQFMAGDAGVPLAEIQAMPSDVAHQRATAYARQVSELTLTHSNSLDKAPFQKLPGAETLNYFWNDLRNVYNGQLSLGRKVKWHSKKINEAMGEGHQMGDKIPKDSIKGAAAALGTIFVGATVIKFYEDWLRGYETTPIDVVKGTDWSNETDRASAADWFAKWISTAPVDVFTSSIPVVRDIRFAAEREDRRSDTRSVQTPAIKVFTDLATTYKALSDLYYLDGHEMSEQQLKSTLFSMSYLTGGAPVNAAWKLKKWIDANADQPVIYTNTELNDAQKQLKEYIEKPPAKATPDNVAEAQETLDQIQPKDPVDQIPEDTLAVIKSSESGGRWDKLGSNGEAGLYQFSLERWTEIMAAAPQLGLTENGRVAKDGKQQELAMKWQSDTAASRFQKEGIPIDTETIYAAHLFGIDNAVKIYQEPADTKTKSVGLKTESKTVGQVRKSIKKKVTDNRLTLAAETEED